MREVWLDGKKLDPKRSQKVHNHSPNGFLWSYGGSAPAQLALAVLLELIPEADACKLYQKFKWDVISVLPPADFEIQFELKDELLKWEPPWMPKWVAKKQKEASA